MFARRLTTVGLLLLLVTAGARAADQDNNVEWSGLTHIDFLDRVPRCPYGGEAFDVVFQTYHYDITSARVYVDDGSVTWVDATFSHQDGPYDVWVATVPATAANSLEYYIEVTDGTDVDYIGPGDPSPWAVYDSPPANGWEINYLTLIHAPIGATLVSPGGTVFKVWAPGPTTAYVAGQFNGWSSTANQMIKIGDYFIAYIANASDRQMYKYVFQPGTVWKPDARAVSLNPSDNYNTHIEDPFRYAWGDDGFVPPYFEDMIIYELHVGTFSGRNDPNASGSIPGTYADVAAHVDHLVDLGINVVELMPINEYPWDFSAGYNPVAMFAPEWKHGTPDDLKNMVDVLHQNGIAVIHDIVWNHFSGTDNYLWNYVGSQIYFDNPAVETPWGSQADFDRQEVRDYFADSSLHWIHDFHFDGYRMDATEFMNLYQGWGWGLMQRYNDELDARAVHKISIAEQLPDDAWVTRPTSLGGAGFDAQWYDAFTDNLRAEILDAGWNQGNVEMWKIRDIILGGGTYLSGAQVVNYLELHDEAWPESGGSRIIKQMDTSFPHDDKYAKGRTKLAYGVVLFAPGIPMILQGTEWLEDTDFGSGTPSGDDRLDWSKKSTYGDIFQYFKDAIAVRKTNGGLRANAGVEVHHVNESNNLIAWHRWDLSGNDLIIVANFGNIDRNNYRVGFPQGGTWSEILNSQAAVYGGNNSGNGGSIWAEDVSYDGMPHSAEITVPEMGVLVFRYGTGSTILRGDANCDGEVNFGDINAFVEALVEGIYCDGTGDNADVDENGSVGFEDINPFVDLLVG